MLFVAEVETCGPLLAPPIPDRVRVAFARLLHASLDGIHLLVAPPPLCTAIEESSDFSVDERASARKIRLRYADFGTLPDKLRCWARVVDGAAHVPQRNGTTWDVPLRWIADRPLEALHLIGEDLNDTTTAVGAAEDYKNSKRLNALSVRVGHHPGGGANTHRVLRNSAIQGQNISYCLVDSDRECPTGAIGKPAQDCLGVVGPGLFQVHVTPGRSIENSIPWRLLDKVRPSVRPAPSQLLVGLERITPKASRFANLKRGCHRHDLTRQSAGSCCGFWSEVDRARMERTACCNDECQASELGLCRDRVFGGIGGTTLAAVGQHLSETQSDPTRSKSYLPSPNDAEWLELGQDVFEYGVALPARRL